MDWDDEYDNGYHGTDYDAHRDNSMPDTRDSDGGLDFKDIVNPVSAYFFLSDGAQDEITGEKRKAAVYYKKAYRFAMSNEGFDQTTVDWFLSEAKRLESQK